MGGRSAGLIRFLVGRLLFAVIAAAGVLATWRLAAPDNDRHGPRGLAEEAVGLLIAVAVSALTAPRTPTTGLADREAVNADTLDWDVGPPREFDTALWLAMFDGPVSPVFEASACGRHRQMVVASSLRGAAHDGFAALRLDPDDAFGGDLEEVVRQRTGSGRQRRFPVPRPFRVAIVADVAVPQGPDVNMLRRSALRFLAAWPESRVLLIGGLDQGCCARGLAPTPCGPTPGEGLDEVPGLDTPTWVQAASDVAGTGWAWRYVARRVPSLIVSVLIVAVAMVTAVILALQLDAEQAFASAAWVLGTAGASVVAAVLLVLAALHLDELTLPMRASGWWAAAGAALAVGSALGGLQGFAPHQSVGVAAAVLLLILLTGAHRSLDAAATWTVGVAGALGWLCGTSAAGITWAVVAGAAAVVGVWRARASTWLLVWAVLTLLEMFSSAPVSVERVTGAAREQIWWESPELPSALMGSFSAVGWCIVAALVAGSTRRALGRFEQRFGPALVAIAVGLWGWRLPGAYPYWRSPVVVLAVLAVCVVSAWLLWRTGRGPVPAAEWRRCVMIAVMFHACVDALLASVYDRGVFGEVQVPPSALVAGAAVVGLVADSARGRAVAGALRRRATAHSALDRDARLALAATLVAGVAAAWAERWRWSPSNLPEAVTHVVGVVVVLGALAWRYRTHRRDRLLWCCLMMAAIAGSVLELFASAAVVLVAFAVCGGPATSGQRTVSLPRMLDVLQVLLLAAGMELRPGDLSTNWLVTVLVASFALFLRPAALQVSFVAARRRDRRTLRVGGALPLTLVLLVVVAWSWASAALASAPDPTSSIGPHVNLDVGLFMAASMSAVAVAAVWALGVWQQAGWGKLADRPRSRSGLSSVQQTMLSRREE